MIRILALLVCAASAQAQFAVSPPPPALEKRVSDLEYRVANLEKLVGTPKVMPATLAPPPVEPVVVATTSSAQSVRTYYTASDGTTYECANGQCSQSSSYRSTTTVRSNSGWYLGKNLGR